MMHVSLQSLLCHLPPSVPPRLCPNYVQKFRMGTFMAKGSRLSMSRVICDPCHQNADLPGSVSDFNVPPWTWLSGPQ